MEHDTNSLEHTETPYSVNERTPCTVRDFHGAIVCLCSTAALAALIVKACNERASLLKKIEADRWVPVEEGLPEDEYGEYLVIRQNYEDEPQIAAYLADVPCNGGKHGWDRGMPVTHWRKITLPQTGEPK